MIRRAAALTAFFFCIDLAHAGIPERAKLVVGTQTLHGAIHRIDFCGHRDIIPNDSQQWSCQNDDLSVAYAMRIERDMYVHAYDFVDDHSVAAHWTALRCGEEDYAAYRYLRVAYPNAELTTDEQHCNAELEHDFTVLDLEEETWLRAPVEHVRTAMVQGTVSVKYDWNTFLNLTLRYVQNGTWHHLHTQRFEVRSGQVWQDFTISAHAPPGVEVFLVLGGRNVIAKDIRLFVEKCIPDASRPGRCLGD